VDLVIYRELEGTSHFLLGVVDFRPFSLFVFFAVVEYILYELQSSMLDIQIVLALVQNGGKSEW
jgi:hypothetical protein